jgi:2-keto-4-pentenoate hydratase/2-oxohepta-3-ene-1,7-dioic acid hydratase in catechol pathway
MGVYVCRYLTDSKTHWGVVEGKSILPFTEDFWTTADFLARADMSKTDRGKAVALTGVELLSPVTTPCRVVCLGVNYRDHKAEAGGGSEPGDNLVFRKEDSSICSPDSTVIRPRHVKLLDYEIELGLVIGRPIRQGEDIHAGNLMEYIAGITIANDYSARDIMVGAQFGQWFRGKSFRTFCPIGPYIYLTKEAGLLEKLHLQLKVNGQVRQDADTSAMIVKPLAALRDIAGFMDLDPGDIVLTGTPGGVAMRAPNKMLQGVAKIFLQEQTQLEMFLRTQSGNPNYLKDGDVVTATIHSHDRQIDLGTQANRVSCEKSY